MMRVMSRWLGCLCCCLLLLPDETFAKETLAWMEAVAPPFFIHEGPYKGQGYEDLITGILEKSLPQYEHKHMQANISRHYQQWKQGENVCSVGMFKTPERLEFAYFSIPSVFTLPTVLIIHKDRFEAFGGEKMVSLAKLLKKGRVVVGRSVNRSYGIEFDTALNTYGNAQNIFTYEGPELSLKPLQDAPGRPDRRPARPARRGDVSCGDHGNP